MADTKDIASSSANASEKAPAGGRVGAWTDAERLLLRVLAVLLPDGKGVDWKNINMPNRTLKAIQAQWTSIIVQMRELGMEGEGNTAAPKAKTRKLLVHSRSFGIPVLMNVFEARKKAAPKQKTAAAGDGQNANEDTGDDQDDEETKKKATPKKRAAATNADGTPKKRRTPAKKSAPKVENDAESDNEAAVPKKEEENGDDDLAGAV
ncbi:hypothetical protein CDEST_05271 [Colletotrichum destructivum]|uniref:Myb-like domain-containing protein n=1 Tax=Colletotrichum destructivum TaxID=34406 RepID=A0AAX4IA44_9PEZI|nr:hypothetical protein CDEST_05271 [Colletotrichum destructivum]